MGTIPIESGEFIFPKNGEILNESSLSLVTASGPSLKRNAIENPTDGTIDKNMYLTKVIATIETPGMTEDEEIELYVFVDNRVVDYTNHGLSIVNDAGTKKLEYKTNLGDADKKITFDSVRYLLSQGENTLRLIVKQKKGNLAYEATATVIIDTYAPNLNINYPISNGNWIIPDTDITGGVINARIDLDMNDVTDTMLFAYVTKADDYNLANIHGNDNKILDKDGGPFLGKEISIKTSERVKIKYHTANLPANKEVGYLYVAAVDNADGNADYNDNTGHINFKKIKFTRTDSVEIGIVRIDGKEYQKGDILEITKGEFNIFVANNDEGATATLETRLQNGTLLKQMSLQPAVGGFEDKSINVRNKLGITSLDNLDIISTILRVRIDSLNLEAIMVIGLQYIDKEQSIDLETDKIEFTFNANKGTKIGVIGDKIYFDKTAAGTPIIDEIKIENPSQLKYLLKVDSDFYPIGGTNKDEFDLTANTTENTAGIPIVLDKSSPKKEVSLYLGKEKIKTYELIYLAPEAADIICDKVTLNPVDKKIKIEGTVDMPISILAEYDLKVELGNVKYTISSNDITYPNSSTMKFNTEIEYNDEIKLNIYLENRYKPIKMATDRVIHNKKIKILGIDDYTDKLLIVDNDQFIKIENIADFNTIGNAIFLDNEKLSTYDFTNGQNVNLTGKTEIRIILNRDTTPDGSIDDPSTYIERTLYIVQPSKDDIPEWLVIPKNNKGYTAEPENGGGTFVVTGRVKNADEVRLGIRLLDTEKNEYNDQIWNDDVPQRTTDGSYINIFLDSTTGNFVSPDLTNAIYKSKKADTPKMISDGFDYEVVLIAVNNSKGISSRVTYTCYYDQTAPTVDAMNTLITLYIDKNGVLRDDSDSNDEIINNQTIGALVKTNTGEFVIPTVNDKEIRFNINPAATQSIILIKNQKGYSDYLVGYAKAPVDEHVTLVIKGEKGTIREYFITKNTDKKLFENLGDNQYEDLIVYFQDIHGIKTVTSGDTLNNNKYVDFDENKISAKIVESAEPKYPLTRIYIDAMPNLNTTSLSLKFSKGGEIIKEQTVTDLKTTLHKFIISSDINSGDDVLLEATDKYSNDVFRSSGEKTIVIPVVDKLAPLLPTMDKLTIVDNPVGTKDTISGTVDPRERGGKVKLIINDEEKAQAIISTNGTFTISCDTSIKETNKKILLAMEDTNGNKTENSNYEARRYIDLTSRFAFNYNGKVKDITSSKENSGSLYGLGEEIVITWDITDDNRADTDDDPKYKNRVSKYRIRFENSSTNEVLLEAFTTEKKYTVSKAENLMGILDKKEIAVKIIPISDLGLSGSAFNNTYKNIFVDTKAPNIDMLEPSKIKVRVKDNKMTFGTGVINDLLNTEDYLDIRIQGAGIDERVRYKDETISKPSERLEAMSIVLPVSIKNTDTFTISLVDGAGNESFYSGQILSYDDEAPLIGGLTIKTSTIDNVNRLIIVEVSYEGEDEMTVVAYRNTDDNEVGTAILLEQGVIYPLFIDGIETDGVYMKIRDKNRGVFGGGNYSNDRKDLTNSVLP